MPKFLANTNSKKNKYRASLEDRNGNSLSSLNQLICGIIGLLLTIYGTFVQAHTIKIGNFLATGAIELQSLNVNFQIAAVLLTGCLGGKNAGAISQVAYLSIGLFFLPVFQQGGTIDYIQQPSFGYLIGFIPGAWLCGNIAYSTVAKLETLAFSAICGLVVVHLCGIFYILGRSLLSYAPAGAGQLILQYSIAPLPGQLIIVCSVATIAFFMRRIMFN